MNDSELAKGFNVVLGVGLEGTPGTPVTPTEWYEFQSESMIREPDIQDFTGLTGSRGSSRTSRREGNIAIGGDINLHARQNIIGNWLYWTMGGGNGAAPSLDDLALPSLSVIVDKFVRKGTYAGCKVNTLALTSETNGPLLMVPTLLGMNFVDAVGNVTTPTYDDQTNYPILMHHGLTLTIDGGSLELHMMGLTFNNNIADDHFVNSQYRTVLPEGRRAIDLALNVDWDTTTQVTRGVWTKFLSGAVASLVATYSDGTHSAAFTMPYVRILTDPVATDGPDYMRVDVTAVADDSGPGQTDALTVVLA